jgi:hypothetical protein
MPGIAGGHKGAWSSQAAKRLQSVGAPRSTGAAWREAHLGDHRGAILALTKAQSGGTHLGLRRNAFPFAGSCGNRRSSGDSPRVRARRLPVHAQRTRGSASRSSARTTKEVRGAGSRRGFARRKTARTFARPSPVPQARSFGSMNLRGSSARSVPARGRVEVKAARGVVASRCRTRNRRRSWWCPCVVVLQKSEGRPRVQRSARSGKVRVESPALLRSP